MLKLKVKERLNNFVEALEPALDRIGCGFHKFYGHGKLPYVLYTNKTFKERALFWFNALLWTFLVVAVGYTLVWMVVGILWFLITTIPSVMLFFFITGSMVVLLAWLVKVRKVE